ncbi:hypothetical protein OPV22_021992 [Ensete ventricosum]|uniref:Hexosyltransferase n=1 Tax=Ensete ventricosum TaxID=4639 RepID=A0AAV8PBN6_ENSVE|nr:hypothetical protein OPV22_021992 [Ensete ventricosum]
MVARNRVGVGGGIGGTDGGICRPMVVLRRPWTTVVILALLAASFVSPLLLFLRVPAVEIFLSHARKGSDREGNGIVKNLSPLIAIEQEVGGGVKEPKGIIYNDEDLTDVQSTYIENVTSSGVANDPSLRNSGGGEDHQNRLLSFATGEGPSNRTSGETKSGLLPQSSTTEKILEMEDQINMAKAYLLFSSSNSKSHLVRELKIRIKEIERVLGRTNKSSDLWMSDLQKLEVMEVTLSKARKAYPDCSAVASKLRAQLYNAEEQLRAQQHQTSYLTHLTARTFPRGLHCLSMRLTTEYFALQPEQRKLPNSQNMHKLALYHYAMFSDNVLACAVLVNSTTSTSMEPEKIVFHVVTNSYNFPAMVMWFLLNPPGKSTIQIQSLDDFRFLPAGFSSFFVQSSKADPRYTSPLNHLRFYLPELFPLLNKIMLLDHDVVVQRDLRRLWSVDMNGKVNGAVDICGDNKTSHKLETLVNLSNPVIANIFDAKACSWAFGMNIFDLQEWRRRGLTGSYHHWKQLENSKQPWKAGSSLLGELLFDNHTMTLDRRWHVLGLGRHSSIRRSEIERAAVIHYDGNMKPWLDVALLTAEQKWRRSGLQSLIETDVSNGARGKPAGIECSCKLLAS